MNIHQPHPKSQQQQQQRVLKPVDMNNPSTPCPNKTYRAPSPASGLTKHQQKPKHHQIYLSPSSLAPYHSPSRHHHIQPKLKQAIQTPCSHGAINTNFKRNNENKKSLSPNTLASKEVGLHYLPTNVTKKPSPRPNKALDLQKYMEQTQKSRGGDFSISSTKMAARMKPDRCSTDHLKLHEISSKRQVMTLGDLGKMDEKPVVEINLSPNCGTHRVGLSQIGQGIEMNLSPISKLKEDLSSFLSDKEKLVCIRHPRKKAKYRAKYGGDSGVEYLYCSECAVELAMKGTQIEKLPLLGLHTRTNTECDERQDTEIQEPVEDPEVTAAINEFRSKLGEVIQEVDTIESRYMDYKETTEIKVELTRETIQCCSENVIALFKEETNKTIDGLNTEMNQRMQSIELYLNQLKDFYKGYIDIKQDFEENFQQSAYKISRKSAQDTIQDFYRRIHEIKNKFTKTTQPAQEIENSCFEAKINDYKKGLKAVLKEVINELEREEVTMTEKAAEQPTMTQSITDENMLKKLGAFEDFLRADESQDALQMRTVPVKPKMGDNMVISFGSKEVFDNVLHTPHEGLTVCSTQGETMVLPSLEEISHGYRACVTEPALYENPRRGNINEDYGKFMNYIESKINDEAEKVHDGSFQKTLFHSPEFKSNDEEDYEIEGANTYYNY